MNAPQQDENGPGTALVDTSAFQRIYFDTSAWGHITALPDRNLLTSLIKRMRQIPLASVVSVAEILRTPDLETRVSLCETILTLHRERPVLEQPLVIAEAVANAFLRGETALCLEKSQAAGSFYKALSDPQNAPIEQVTKWINDMNSKLERFIRDIRPLMKDEVTNYLSSEVLEREDFLAHLCMFPTAQKLGLSVDQVRGLCRSTDIWRALAAMLAYIFQLYTTSARKRRKKDGKRQDRPDGADMWQTLYLACAQVFVTGDVWLLEAATEVSRLLKWPRCTLLDLAFLDGLRKLSSTGGAGIRICSVCGIPRSGARGGHAVVN